MCKEEEKDGRLYLICGDRHKTIIELERIFDDGSK